MSFEPGRTLAHYEILEPIGKGGMGEVFRARDGKLGRDVAIKVLPEDVAGDEARLARFRREAQVLASLNHPNIAAIYGLEESDGVAALVLELVEGEDLADRLKRGAIPYEEAMAVARELAAGLEAAHEKGIVHRDLKPGNIKLGADGGVKILDFGLAKAYDPEAASGGDSALSQSPTISRQMTQAGVILGTAAYMSPEQAKGKPVDKRADIWAFGVVLFEMLSGRRLFDGEDLTETLASVVKDEPDLSAVPREVRRLLAKCLERDPKRRLRDIGDAWALLEDSETVTVTPSRVPWAVAAAAALLAVASFSLWTSSSQRSEVSAQPVRFRVQRPESVSPDVAGRGSFRLSPDGRHLALTEGGRLWIRSLGSFDARALEGTQGATYPFWAPDSSSIGFFADGQLKKVTLDGVRVQVLCDASGGRGATWSREGTILFSPRGGAGIFRVPAQGGTPEAVTMIGPSAGDEEVHRYPEFLPDSERFLYLHLTGEPDTAGVYVGSTRGAQPVRVLPGSDIASYAPPAITGEHGHLLFRQDRTLMAQPFDLDRLENAGPVFPVVGDVGGAGNTGYAAFSVSRDGTLAYSPGEENAVELVWRTRSGERGPALPAGSALDFALSPDGQTAAMSIADGHFDVWLQDTSGGTPSRFTFGPSPGWVLPVWSPDGERLIFTTSDLAGQKQYEIRVKRRDMSGPERTIARSDTMFYLTDWSPDGAHVLYSAPGETGFEIWSVSVEENGEAPTRHAAGSGNRLHAQYSPNGRWLAYGSDEHGELQVFVEPSDASGAIWQISTEGGGQPRWRGDSQELYYRAPNANGTLMAVAIGTRKGRAPASGTLEHGTPEPLFDSVLASGQGRFTYEPASDGQRFLVFAPVSGSKEPISVVLNWQASIAN